jgi:hypothetical protein
MNISPNIQHTTYNIPQKANDARVGNAYADEVARVQAEMRRAELAALKAKPVQYKLHQANEATRPVREAVRGVFKWIKDAATGRKFQLFPEPGVWFRKGPAQNHGTPRIR